MAGRSPSTEHLDEIVQGIRESLAVRHRARETAFTLSREVIRGAANTIRAVHREELERARGLLTETRGLLVRIEEAVAEHPELRHAGYVDDAQKEYAEAAITLALVSGMPLPDPASLGVGGAPYLNGMAEAASELRRHLLDLLRRDHLERCETVLNAMDDIYNVLITIDFPEAITGGLRRTTDQLRAVLERTRGDLTLAIVQNRLAEQIRQAERWLPAGPESNASPA